MESKKRLFLGLLLATSTSFAQNIGFGEECSLRNSAILSQAILDVVGDDFVSDCLDNNVRMLSFWELDNDGRIDSLVPLSVLYRGDTFPVRYQADTIPEGYGGYLTELFNELERYFIDNRTVFKLCYEEPYGETEDIACHRIVEYHQENKRNMWINVSFPSDFMTYYNLAKRKAIENDLTPLSKLEYFKSQIQKYLD